MAARALIHLRCRTEYSYRTAYGKVSHVADRLAALGAAAAGIVDGAGTWGHVRWARELTSRGIKPLFGAEVALCAADGKRPRFWLLAAETRAFYRTMTALQRCAGEPAETQLALLRDCGPGVVRFAGTALCDPDTFDYVDINPASPLAQQRALQLHAATGKPLVVTANNYYPAPEDLDVFLAAMQRQHLGPHWLPTVSELREQMAGCLSRTEFDRAMDNAAAVAAMCAGELPRAPMIRVDGESLDAAVEAGRRERLRLGHLASWTSAYQQRLDYELALIREKAYESYFLVVADLVRWAKSVMFVGPGRGSSAGSLVCYLLRITEIDPLEHGLLFERFIDVSRMDLPDIDIDFSQQQLVFDYLPRRYGQAKVARIGNVNTMRARTVIGRACAALGIPEREKYAVLDALIEYSSGDSRYGHALEDTLTQTAPGRRFIAQHPEAQLMFALENHASHAGVHAAGVIVCNDAVSDYCTVSAERTVHLDKLDTEALNLLKIDALGLRTLAVIEDAGVTTPNELYALRLDDPAVFSLFNDRRYAGIFQFEGQAQRCAAAEIRVQSFRQLDHITALARPGPLGGGASQKYIARAAGREPVQYRHPSMKVYLEDTLGVVLYQEQVMRICFEIGQFDWRVVAEIRKAMSGRKGKEYFDRRGAQFIAGAQQHGLSSAEAEIIWNEICTFGAWGMNKSHTVSYSVISYWCAWLKVYHPLQYLAAALRNAKDDAQAIDLLRDADREGVSYVAFDPARSAADWSVVDGQLIGGFQNLKGFGPAKAAAAVARRAAGTLDVAKLASRQQIKYQDLYPLHSRWGHIYTDPTLAGCRPGSRFVQLDKLPAEGDVLLLACVQRKELRDENETVRTARRGGKRISGQTLFLDVFVTDDSGVPIKLRFDRFIYPRIGARAAEQLKVGDVVMVRGWRIPNFAMVKVKRIRCLTRPEVFPNHA